MSKIFLGQAFLFLFTSTLLYFSGGYLKTMPQLESFFDGIIVMVFFFSLIPFLTVLTIFTRKILKTLTSFKVY